jgi:Co/Zn/Cd efflux system component
MSDKPPTIARTFLMFTIAMLALLVIFLTAKALAHDHEHPELNGWYQSLHAGGMPCCDGTDAVHLAEPDWESHDGHYRVRLPKNPNITYDLEVNGEWVDVPDEAVVHGPNLDGRALVWPMYRDGHPIPRCFMPGSMT